MLVPFRQTYLHEFEILEMNTEVETSKIPKWLKRVQENSWEAEILISGGAIFSLFQLNYLIEDWSLHLREMRHFMGHNEVYMFINFGVNGLTIGFFSNLIVRGFWIALVCLNYSFPLGINFTNLKIKGRYLNQAKSTNLLNQIIKLDHLAGLLFFGSLTFVIVVLGIIILLVVYFLSVEVLNLFAVSTYHNFTTFSVILIPYFIFLIDFLGSGFLRRNKLIGTIYKPLYFIFNYITLAFIYRPWLQILFTNTAKWKIYMIAFTLFFLSATFTTLTVSRILSLGNALESRDYLLPGIQNYREEFYENRIQGDRLVRFACIQSDLVNDDYLRIFINYDQRYDQIIAKTKSNNLSDIFHLEIDKKIVSSEWLWGKRIISDQYGITCYLPIKEIQDGRHELTIYLGAEYRPFPLTIPFWKQ